MALKWNFWRGGGGGFKLKNLPWEEYGYYFSGTTHFHSQMQFVLVNYEDKVLMLSVVSVLSKNLNVSSIHVFISLKSLLHGHITVVSSVTVALVAEVFCLARVSGHLFSLG